MPILPPSRLPDSASFRNWFVAGFERCHYRVPLALDVGAVGVQPRLEPGLREDLLAGSDVGREREPHPERNDADIGDEFHAEPPGDRIRDSVPCNRTELNMAPPPHAARISTRFPGVATFNIDGPGDGAGVSAVSSDSVEDGTLRRTRHVSARASRELPPSTLTARRMVPA